MGQRLWYNLFMSQLIGHQGVLDLLVQMHSRGRLSHALLLVGPKSVGKRTLAELLLSIIYDLPSTSSDFFLIERQLNDKDELKKNISIDQIRELRHKLQMSTMGGGWKAAIVDEAETLSIEAANALLKTLEEPTPKTQLVLLTTHLSGVPATIASRCQMVELPLVSHSVMAKNFGEVLAMRAAGRPGLAIRLKTDEEAATRYEQQAGAWQRLQRVGLAEKMGLVQKSLKQWDARELVDVWEREAHREFLQKPSSALAQTLRRMAEGRQAILGNVNVCLAIEHVFIIN